MKMFGTNGIRGIPNEFLNCNNLTKIGMSIAFVLGPGPIAIARDPRISSDMLVSSVSAGIMSMGIDVHDLGMIPTPALQLYVKNHKISGGVMITASHNPPEFNGVKCISSDGTECSPEEESAIEDAFDRELKIADWNRIGNRIVISDAAEQYVESIIDKADTELIRKANLKVCVDCANGAGCFTTPMILKRLGVKTIAINANPDGNFPGHHSEPLEKNLGQLIQLMKNGDTDLGAAHDGDADRCCFVTGSGKYLTGDISLALLSREAVSQCKGKAVTTVATSSLVTDCVEQNNGSVILTAVGSPIVARKMMESGAIIGGEDNGGTIFGDHQFCRDGAMAIVRMLELIARHGNLDGQVDALPKYHTIKAVMHCNNRLKTEMLNELRKKIFEGNINTVDGIRVDYNDGWVIMRPSGTEPKFRITSESTDQNIAKERSERFVSLYETIYSKLEVSL